MNDSNLIPAKKGEVRNPNGRPKNLFTQIINELKELGYERVTITNIIEAYEFCLGLDKEKIVEITNNEKSPMFLRIVGKGMLSKKGFDIIEKMIDRAHGKTTQKVESMQLNISSDTMTKEQLELEVQKAREVLS